VRFPTERPKVLLVSSIASLLVVGALGYLAVADQQKRIDDPVRYAEQRCEGRFTGDQVRSAAFDNCVAREKGKSTIASILPFFILGIVLLLVGIGGIFVGSSEVRAEQERHRKMTEGFGETPES